MVGITAASSQTSPKTRPSTTRSSLLRWMPKKKSVSDSVDDGAGTSTATGVDMRRHPRQMITRNKTMGLSIHDAGDDPLTVPPAGPRANAIRIGQAHIEPEASALSFGLDGTVSGWLGSPMRTPWFFGWDAIDADLTCCLCLRAWTACVPPTRKGIKVFHFKHMNLVKRWDTRTCVEIEENGKNTN